MSPKEHDDRLLDEYLDGDSALSRLYRRGAHEEPGARLDARIRDQARRAVVHRARGVRSPFARHWMVPTSLAAMLVLSVSVVLLMPDPASEPGVESEQAGASRGDTPATAAGMEPAPASTPPALESDRYREQGSNEPGDADKAPGAAPYETPAIRQSADAVGAKPDKKRRASALERQEAGAEEIRAAPAPLDSSPASAPQSHPSASQALGDDPQAWLRFIEALLDRQRLAEAESELRAFTRRYPHFPLPERLAELAASLDARPP